jgi:hypothetical protein
MQTELAELEAQILTIETEKAQAEKRIIAGNADAPAEAAQLSATAAALSNRILQLTADIAESDAKERARLEAEAREEHFRRLAAIATDATGKGERVTAAAASAIDALAQAHAQMTASLANIEDLKASFLLVCNGDSTEEKRMLKELAQRGIDTAALTRKLWGISTWQNGAPLSPRTIEEYFWNDFHKLHRREIERKKEELRARRNEETQP